MPTRARSKRAPAAASEAAALGARGRAVSSRRSARGFRSSPVPGLPDEDGESDDPLALTPLRPRSATQRKRQNASRSSLKAPRRQERTVDRVVGGVQMGEGDLVPPSDEEEFDDWAAQRLQEMQSELGDGSTVSRTRSESARPGMTPSSPTGMIVSHPIDACDTIVAHTGTARESSNDCFTHSAPRIAQQLTGPANREAAVRPLCPLHVEQ